MSITSFADPSEKTESTKLGAILDRTDEPPSFQKAPDGPLRRGACLTNVATRTSISRTAKTEGSQRLSEILPTFPDLRTEEERVDDKGRPEGQLDVRKHWPTPRAVSSFPSQKDRHTTCFRDCRRRLRSFTVAIVHDLQPRNSVRAAVGIKGESVDFPASKAFEHFNLRRPGDLLPSVRN